MSFQFVQCEKMRRTPFGKFKLWIWDCWTAWMGFFDIYVGDLPKRWTVAG